MEDNNGITGGIDTTLPIAMTISAFSAIAFYNALSLNVMICMTFKRYSGLYFYSLLASSWGVIVYQLAFLMKFFQVWKNNYVSVTFITIGWYAMVTGQSLVLYSRLHLVVHDRQRLRWVLYMICIDVVLFHFPTTVLTFGVCELNPGCCARSANNHISRTLIWPRCSKSRIRSWKRSKSPHSPSKNSSFQPCTCTRRTASSSRAPRSRRNARGKSCCT